MTNQNPYLSEHHLTMLKVESGISDQVIDARGYRTVTEKGELIEYGFSPIQRRVPGLLIPLHTPDGNIGLHVYRPDNPRTAKIEKSAMQMVCIRSKLPNMKHPKMGKCELTVPLFAGMI